MVAGPNGAGKTTLTKHLQQGSIDLGEYINPDEIAVALSGTLEQRTAKAQQIADERRDSCIRAKRSFTFETVMSHPSKIEVLIRAKEAGYTVILYFIGTDDPQTTSSASRCELLKAGTSFPKKKSEAVGFVQWSYCRMPFDHPIWRTFSITAQRAQSIAFHGLCFVETRWDSHDYRDMNRSEFRPHG
jgi:energy-coupling factor transporter ATP-binding protein EcfA2